MAAAIRASVATQQQQEIHRSEDREEGSRLKKEEAGMWEEPRGARRLLRTQGEGPGELALPADSSACVGSHLGSSLVTPEGLLLPRHRVLLCLVGPKEASTNGPLNQEAFPANSSAAGSTHLRYTCT